jgi:hypothetical protein
LLTQSIAEGALLSIIGGALALWVADVGLRALMRTYPAALPRSSEAAVDLRVLLFTGGIAAVTSLFFGLAQLRHTGAKGLAVVLTAAGAKGGTGTMRHHVRRGLVVAELALADNDHRRSNLVSAARMAGVATGSPRGTQSRVDKRRTGLLSHQRFPSGESRD